MIEQAAFNAATQLRGDCHADFIRKDAFIGPLGIAAERIYRVREVPDTRVRVVASLACAGEAVYVVTEVWSRAVDAAGLDDLLRTITVTEPAPICTAPPD